MSSDDAYPGNIIKALSNRVEAAEKFCEANAASHQGVLERVEKLENRVESHSYSNALRDNIYAALEDRIAALEASKAQPEPCSIPYKTEDYATPEGLARIWAEDMKQDGTIANETAIQQYADNVRKDRKSVV